MRNFRSEKKKKNWGNVKQGKLRTWTTYKKENIKLRKCRTGEIYNRENVAIGQGKSWTGKM